MAHTKQNKNFNLAGLASINVELSSRCNKRCPMCNWYKTDRPKIDMDIKLAEIISSQLPEGLPVQFHLGGESLMHHQFADIMKLFSKQIRCVSTNGKLLFEKSTQIIDNVEVLTVSTFEGDKEGYAQIVTLKTFLEIKKERNPRVIIRCLGEIDEILMARYIDTGCQIIKRVFQSPEGSYGYKAQQMIPEHGICLDMIGKPAISVNGDVSICCQIDPDGLGLIGNIKNNTLEEIWNCGLRKYWLKEHIDGNRKMVPRCATCEYWGIPSK